jgi:hypothetical protein
VRTIANRVYTQEDIILNNEVDDITVTLRPLPIARLREFMTQWDKMEALGEKGPDADEDEIFAIYVNCCAVALRKQLSDKVDGRIYDDKREFTAEYIELLEDYLDLQSIIKILDICGGVKLGDPKLMETLEALIETDQEPGDGTN